MFRRSIEMKVVKTPKTEEAKEVQKKDLGEITVAIQKIGTTFIRESGKVAGVLIVLDALRKIALAGLTQQS